MSKLLTQREGFINRHLTPLPDKECDMDIIYNGIDGEHILNCHWNPFGKTDYTENTMPVDGYLGTARVNDRFPRNIGFHAWKQNDSEFIFYAIK